jgi:hypothetical protein
VVWNRHGLDIDRVRIDGMLATLAEVAAARYPGGFTIDRRMRRIANHFHADARPGHPRCDSGWPPTSKGPTTLLHPALRP